MEKKVLFVIPAYNEEKSIGMVIDEINKEFKGSADIIVVNDCSKDSTAKIALEKGVYCVTMPFNVRYAMAVQTGIKFAYENNYDYVIQFDADGQHIASEANKLLKRMEKDDCDIVIGSRFISKTDYKHSFFRRLGTGLFRRMIKRLCHETITDPTSGFQCLNKKVIAHYAKMGQYPEFPDANLIIDMLYKGYRIKEISAKMRERQFGESMHSGILKPAKYMIKVIYTILIIILRNIGRKKIK